jgi:hypothetical protein
MKKFMRFLVFILFLSSVSCFTPNGLKIRIIETKWDYQSPQNVEGFTLHCGKKTGRYDLEIDVQAEDCATGNPAKFSYDLELKQAYKCFMVTGFNSSGQSLPSNESCVKK